LCKKAISNRKIFGQNIGYVEQNISVTHRISEEKIHDDASCIIAYPSLMQCEPHVVPARSRPSLVAVSPTEREGRLALCAARAWCS